MRLLHAFLNVNVPIQGSTAYHYPGAGHSWSQKFLPKLTITAEIARHFWDFSSVLGKMQFCRGDGLEEQLQLIAASESHLSFIFAICRFCSQQHRNQNLQKRKQARLALCQTICSSFFLLIRPSFSYLKTFAQESKTYA